ncbi:MAG: Serine/threonine-protein phosphatase 2A activator 2 [Phylliscum demangeonii]|nr:MAG: Serine/threonine-protein phosphatase 2A activator 2 [Phylliscum demangeonii]
MSTPAPAPHPPDLSKLIPRLIPRPRRQAPPSAGTGRGTDIPVPATPALPPPPTRAQLRLAFGADPAPAAPRRLLVTAPDLALFGASATSTLVQAWVFSLTDAVRDRPLLASAAEEAETDAAASATVRAVLRALDEVEAVVRACPAVDQAGSRFGNPAFRTFLDRVRERGRSWHQTELVTLMGDNDDDDDDGRPWDGRAQTALQREVLLYFLQSWGNASRIDYGSGHELNFILWLLCLHQLGLFAPADFAPIVLRIFRRYLRLMRLLQTTYYLEPAGSHGVWGLDDYQFLPFLFGAAQLLHHPFLRPACIHHAPSLEQYAPRFLYLDQVAFINAVKNVDGLRWHSPMLDDISAAKSWAKIEAGMRRVFVHEVLGKLPVMQHFWFGVLLPPPEPLEDCRAEESRAEEEKGDDGDDDGGRRVAPAQLDRGHGHGQGDGHAHHARPEDQPAWGDCCGIRVPGSIGAAEEMRKRMGQGAQALRRLPFD